MVWEFFPYVIFDGYMHKLRLNSKDKTYLRETADFSYRLPIKIFLLTLYIKQSLNTRMV